MPAIAINLVGAKRMIASIYHYDDIPSTMLFLSIILILNEKNILSSKDIFSKWIKSFYINNQKDKLKIINSYWFIIVFITGFFLIKASFIHHFNFKDKNAYKATANFIPTKETLAVLKELKIINKYNNDTVIYTQGGLRPYINLKNLELTYIKNFIPVINYQCELLPESKSKNSLLVFYKNTYNFHLKNLEECLPIIENNNPDLKRLKKFKHLTVFEYQ